MSRFSESAGGVDGVAGAVPAKGLNEGLRDMARRDPSVAIVVCVHSPQSMMELFSVGRLPSGIVFKLVKLLGGQWQCWAAKQGGMQRIIMIINVPTGDVTLSDLVPATGGAKLERQSWEMRRSVDIIKVI